MYKNELHRRHFAARLMHLFFEDTLSHFDDRMDTIIPELIG